MNGDSLFSDLMAASARLQSAYFILKDAGDLETARMVYLAQAHVNEAIHRLIKEYSVEAVVS